MRPWPGSADQVDRDAARARRRAQAHVAGNSLGGWLAVELARRGLRPLGDGVLPAGGWRSDEDYQVDREAAFASPTR